MYRLYNICFEKMLFKVKISKDIVIYLFLFEKEVFDKW